MIKLKRIVAAGFAVMTSTLALTSAAGAAYYTASAYPTTATGTSPIGNTVFQTEAGKMECASHYQGTLTAASSDFTATVQTTGCKAFGFVEAVVSGCTYTFTEPTGAGDNWSAKVDVVGAPCTITAGTCKVSIPLQGPLSNVVITNDTAAGDMTIRANVIGIKYTVVHDGFGCPYAGTGDKLNATYTQGAAVTFDSTNGTAVDIG
jgi:hypothetical protein